MALLAGTRFMEAVRIRHRAGAIVAGTSADASILASQMMAEGESDSPPRKGIVEMAAGFCLIADVIIDQHFNVRGRIGRLLVLLSANPGLVALGIDENTAGLITPDGMVEAIGADVIMILDGRNVYSNYFGCEEGEIVTVTGSSLHEIGRGHTFDLHKRLVVGLREELIALDRS